MRIGVYGGTFDPPHLGHLIVAGDVHARLGLDRVVWIPAAVQPLKGDAVRTPAPLRLQMVRAAVENDPRFSVDDLELHRSGPSYTVDTLRRFRERPGVGELFLLVGADVIAQLPRWHRPDEVARLCRLAVLDRGGRLAAAMRDAPLGSVAVPVTRIDLSSTEIRRRVAAGEPVRYLLPDSVKHIVEREGLYKLQC